MSTEPEFIVAPCGCAFEGRFTYTAVCTEITSDMTGSQRIRHSERVRKDAR